MTICLKISLRNTGNKNNFCYTKLGQGGGGEEHELSILHGESLSGKSKESGNPCQFEFSFFFLIFWRSLVLFRIFSNGELKGEGVNDVAFEY